ncbi:MULTISPECIES: D-erythronate dehydrogenase [unclassified Rhizobium]|uniref:D-erythronate dehydrogenase n=1 Tax=unclassified Rhizobium TaxID=2613769 RepID=UPI001ADBDE05|nr:MULTISPECIES: D-erythronate dehydrogenase [unclassified Rhizobium]MBO9172262.1 SDR family oxidoreductase [Rhizobium sp. L245/93]QXZ80407.1 SDR family oxidoreductase [Rhizobium sp. L51/94]QYA04688.1 SDR family oxidoreductase [Rhizobium sp. B21/90]
MRIAILGAAGMLGRRLTERLAAEGELAGKAITAFTLHDIVPAARVNGNFDVDVLTSDFSDQGEAERILLYRPDVIFHLAAVVSGEAEADLEKGYRVNLEGTRALLNAVRTIGQDYRPRFVFTSSIAVFGAPLPDVIPDDYLPRPLSSYGAQKAMGELLVADYARRGIIDGLSIRLPTICVRPGKPNKAASSFYSSIIREPLNGEEAVLPVSRDIRHWFASPRKAVDFLIRAAEVAGPDLTVRALTMPGVSASVEDQIEALRKVAGDDAVALIREEPDPAIHMIVSSWPKSFDARLALDLGFVPDASFDEIVQIYCRDELKCG